MTPFNVLATVDVLSKNHLHLIIEAYQCFYQQQTPKHQGNIHLHLFSKKITRYTHNGVPLTELGMNIHLQYTTDIAKTQQLFDEASILFLPIREAPGPIVKELLICGVPIFCHRDSIIRKQVDRQIALVTNTKQLEEHQIEQAIEDYAQYLDMLYFDSGVQKILKKKANKKYRRKINNGGQGIAHFLQEGIKSNVASVKQLMPH